MNEYYLQGIIDGMRLIQYAPEKSLCQVVTECLGDYIHTDMFPVLIKVIQFYDDMGKQRIREFTQKINLLESLDKNKECIDYGNGS